MSNTIFETQIMRLGEKQNIEALKTLINNTNMRELTTALKTKLGRNDCINFWNYLLLGFDLHNFEAREKRFACVKCFLDGLLKIELSYKQAYDLITRLCQDLTTFSSTELIEILEHCMDSLRTGDAKCISWKDLLPATLNVLAPQTQFNVNGVNMRGAEYRETVVRNLCTLRWPTAVLTPLADMYKELNLKNSESLLVLHKFASALQELSPMELPALAFQLFSLCSSAAQIIIPIFALEKYFYRYYYKKLFSDMNSNSTDFDSIDAYSDKELREAEETILHHLNYCTQYKISEAQICLVLRNFITMPDVILTPFMLSAILTMTTANREPETTRISSAILLPFLRQVIKNNEDERSLADYSIWCRDTLQRKQIDLEQVFTVLIDNNTDGKDVITPGLVNLAFILLKAKNCRSLHNLAINFLTKFIRKRFVFGQGVVKRIAEWMIVEQDQYQYSECLTMLSVADTLTVSECLQTIKYVMDFFLWLPGEQAMRMMSFILPVLKISNIVRDEFIEMLRKAMNSSDPSTTRMAVYGFCMILKQLNNSNSQRGTLGASGYCTQHSISGYSLMTQSTFGSRSNPLRNFDMLTLEIIGLLRNCLTKSLDIKRTLYENLQRAVELNPKLVPHVLQFIDWHFRSFFILPTDDVSDEEFGINYELLVEAHDMQHMELEVKDNLGYLIQFLAHALLTFEKINTDYDVREMQRILNTCIARIVAKQLKFENSLGAMTNLKCALLQQQMQLLQALIAYSLLSSKQTNDQIKQIIPLYKQHAKLQDDLKKVASNVKKSSKPRSNTTVQQNDTELMPTPCNDKVAPAKKLYAQVENIWDIAVLEKLLRVTHEDIVPFAASQHTQSLRANVEFVRYVLEVTIQKVESIRLEPEYKQLSHSKRTLKYLTDITRIIYERCIKRLPELWRDFDMLTAVRAAQCFLHCFKTANETYKKRFAETFMKGFDFHVINKSKSCIYVLQDIIDIYMKEDLLATAPDNDSSVGKQIPQVLLQCLEVLCDNISFDQRPTIESYSWLLKFCQTYELDNNEFGIVHKLLFTQRQKTHSGAFYVNVALHLGKVWGTVSQDDENEEADAPVVQHAPGSSLNLKSITNANAESCFQYLVATISKQIEDVEHFINKANNQNYKCRIISAEDRTFCHANLVSLERGICTQLIHVSKPLLALTNTCVPLGACMDSLLRLVMQHYNCLKNLAKHYLQCNEVDHTAIKSTKFDYLLHVVGKPLPTNIYALIRYIEENILEEHSKKKIKPQAEKAKVLRETKLIPKLILSIENFNKHVILLAKKTSERLTNYLHFGTVRDFRIKTDDLKAAIERTYSHSSQIELVVSDLNEEQTNENSNENDDVVADADDLEGSVEREPLATANDVDTTENVDSTTTKKKRVTRRGTRRAASRDTIEDSVSDASTPTPTDELARNKNNPVTTTQFLKNLTKINKQAKKRALLEAQQNDANSIGAAGAVAAVPAEPKRKRARAAKK